MDPHVSKDGVPPLPAFIERPLPQFLPRSGGINQIVTLNGTNFNAASTKVRFGEVPALVIGAASATQLLVRVPPGLTPAGTPVEVKITVTDRGGSRTSDDTFTPLPTPVFVEAGGQFIPNHGTVGQPIAVNGFNFNAGNARVLFGATPAMLVEPPTANRVVALVPAGLVPVDGTTAEVKIMVLTTAGSALSDDVFRAESTTPMPNARSPR